MILFTIVGVIAAFFFFIVIFMTIIEGRIKNKSNEKLIWKMDKVEKVAEESVNGRNSFYGQMIKKHDKKTQ